MPAERNAVAITLDPAEVRALEAYCVEDVRPVTSWFRRAILRGWATRETRRRTPSGIYRRRNPEPGESNMVVWTRMTVEERRRLDILCDEEDVAPSEWFRRRIADEFGEIEPTRRAVKKVAKKKRAKKAAR